MSRISFLYSLVLSGMLLVAGCGKKSTAPPAPPPSGGDTVWPSPVHYRDMLKTGVDVDWAKNDNGIAAYNVKAVQDFKARGISHVRIRVSNDISAALLTHLDRIVNDCINNNLVPVVAYQADAFKLTPFTSGVLENAVNWWKSTAETLKDYPGKLSFDLMIECSDSLNDYPQRLNEYFEKAVAEIRKSNPKRIIIISPVVRSSPENLPLIAIPTQHNNYLMAEWHMYASGPSRTNPVKLWTTGTAAEKKLITDKINAAVQWQNSKGIPTWVGAWMPGNYNDGDDYSVAEQVVFATFISCELRKKGIPYAVNSDTKFYDRTANTWITPMAPVVDSFINPNCQ